jgi:hypothetical protein
MEEVFQGNGDVMYINGPAPGSTRETVLGCVLGYGGNESTKT